MSDTVMTWDEVEELGLEEAPDSMGPADDELGEKEPSDV